MKKLKKEEKNFLELILKKGRKEIKKGYNYITFQNKHYKLARIKFQLINNVRLEISEIVHHKDENKLNDFVENLKMMTIEEHSSLHRNARKIKQKNS